MYSYSYLVERWHPNESRRKGGDLDPGKIKEEGKK